VNDERFLVELTRANPALARHELASVLRRLGGSLSAGEPLAGLERVELPGREAASALGSSLGNGRAVYRSVARGSLERLSTFLRKEGKGGGTVRLRVRSGSPPGRREEWIRRLGREFVEGGGKVDLERPDLDLELVFDTAREPSELPEGSLLKVVGRADRAALRSRRSARLPFRQPVTLPPWLARSLVNLAEVPPGGVILDPFCGTGAIPIEGALLGYEAWIGDRSSKMVQGALRNFGAVGVSVAQAWIVDLDELPGRLPSGRRADGLVTDPPYGRASASGKEDPRKLWDRLLALLPELVAPQGTAILLLPHERAELPLPPGWQGESLGVAQRVHASLTRYVYRLRGPEAPRLDRARTPGERLQGAGRRA
jgi:putative methyltransferase (TIGR01177 family)